MSTPPRVALFLTLVIILLGPALARPEPAAAIPGPCDVPGVSLVCAAGGRVLGVVGDAAGGAVREAARGVLGTLTGWVGDGAAWLTRRVIAAINGSTGVDLEAGWFTRHYRFYAAVGGLLLLPFLLLAVLQAILRQDPALLLRAAFLHLPAAVLLTGAALAATRTALAVVDALSGELAGGLTRDADRLAESFSRVVLGSGGATSPLPLFVGFLVALMLALGAFVVWVELVVRAAALYAAVAFLPLTLAAMTWPAAVRWARRLAEMIGALVLGKLVIVGVLSLGLAAIAEGDGAAAVLAGAAMFMVAAFSPFVVLSLVPLAAEAAPPAREGRRALGAATGSALVWQAARIRLTGTMAGGGQGRGPSVAGPGLAPRLPTPRPPAAPAGGDPAAQPSRPAPGRPAASPKEGEGG